jgi:hypothetical protein
MSRILLGTGTQLHTVSQSADIDLDGLIDVVVTSPANNQILRYNSTDEKWNNVTAGDVVDLALNELTDVTITSVSNGQSLQYNSTSGKWENANIVATLVDGGTY